MKLAKISTLETEELACYITGFDYDEIDADDVFGLGEVERQPVRWENCAKPVLYEVPTYLR